MATDLPLMCSITYVLPGGVGGVLERPPSLFRQAEFPLLRPKAKAGQMGLVIAAHRVAAQAITVPLCLDHEAVVLDHGASADLAVEGDPLFSVLVLPPSASHSRWACTRHHGWRSIPRRSRRSPGKAAPPRENPSRFPVLHQPAAQCFA